MKSLITYIQESLIIEGGHSIEDAQPIRGDLAKKVADEIIKVIKGKFNCECVPLGSVGKKGADKTSGDIDIAIEYPWEDKDTVIEFVKKEFNTEIGNINNQLHVFNIGYQYNEDTTPKIVQVDFMFTDNIDFAKFAYNSPDFTKNESKYKGMYQSGLLMAAISNTPVDKVLGDEYKEEYFTENDYDGSYKGQIKSYWKFLFNQHDGLKLEHKTYAGKTKLLKTSTTIKEDGKVITKDVKKILKLCLGEKATRETCNSFESELKFLCSKYYKFYSKEQLNKIKDSFLNDWQLKMKTDASLMKEFENIFNEEINK